MGAEHWDAGSCGIHFTLGEHLLSQIFVIYQSPGKELCLLGLMNCGEVGVTIQRKKWKQCGYRGRIQSLYSYIMYSYYTMP